MISTCIKNRPFFIEKAYKIGLNGITKQKQGSYKSRYCAGARYVDLPKGEVVPRPPCHNAKDTTKKQKTKIVPEVEKGSEWLDPVKEVKKRTLNKRKVRTRIMVYADTMRRSSRWKHKELYFWTISFPKGTPDDTCYQLLNIWLTQLREKKLLASYLWVAERQQNNTIHFHLLIPQRVNVKVANRLMMTSICSMIRKGLLPWNIHAAKKYNGVDIAKDRKNRKVINFLEKKRSRSLQRYITKYITKNSTEMVRACWNCSTDWSVLFSACHLTREELVATVPDVSAIRQDRKFENDWVEFWPWNNDPPLSFMRHMAAINGNILYHYFGTIGKREVFLN
jgi:hypothetical protein